ncbi:metallophosphoesterase family protein [Candidatus Hydrogenedentota bacterium]
MCAMSRREFIGTLSAGVVVSVGMSVPVRADGSAVIPQLDLTDFSFEFVDPPDWMFAVMADTHVTPKMPPEGTSYASAFNYGPPNNAPYHHELRFQKTIEVINSLKPDFVLHCGDIGSSLPLKPVFEEQSDNAVALLKTIDVPVYLCPGNHDVGVKHSLLPPDAPEEKLQEYMEYLVSEKHVDKYEKFYGPSYHSFDHKGCHFVLLNDLVFGSGLDIEKKEWEWLEKDLEEASKTARMIFLVHHTPLFWVDPAKDMRQGHYFFIDKESRERLLGLIERYNVRADFTGHLHHSLTNLYGDSLMLTTNAMCFNVKTAWFYNWQKGKIHPSRAAFNLVRVYGEKFRINQIRIVEDLPDVASSDPRRVMSRLSAECAGGSLAVTTDPPLLIKPPKTKSGKPEQSLTSDNNWHSAFDVGATLLRINPERLAFERIMGKDFSDGPMMRGIEYALRQRARVILPVDSNSVVFSEKEWKKYIASLMKSVPGSGRLWELDAASADGPQRNILEGAISQDDQVLISGVALSEAKRQEKETTLMVSTDLKNKDLAVQLSHAMRSGRIKFVNFSHGGDAAAADIVRAYILCLAHRVTPCFDLRRKNGLLGVGDEPSPAYCALRTVNTVLGGYRSESLSATSILFSKPGHTCRVFWDSTVEAAGEGLLVNPATATVTQIRKDEKLSVVAMKLPQLLVTKT